MCVCVCRVDHLKSPNVGKVASDSHMYKPRETLWRAILGLIHPEILSPILSREAGLPTMHRVQPAQSEGKRATHTNKNGPRSPQSEVYNREASYLWIRGTPTFLLGFLKFLRLKHNLHFVPSAHHHHPCSKQTPRNFDRRRMCALASVWIISHFTLS